MSCLKCITKHLKLQGVAFDKATLQTVKPEPLSLCEQALQDPNCPQIADIETESVNGEHFCLLGQFLDSLDSQEAFIKNFIAAHL